MVVVTADQARPRGGTVAVALLFMVLGALLSAAVAVMYVNDYIGYAAVAARAGANIGAPERVPGDIATQHTYDAICVVAYGLMALVLLGTALWARRSSAGRVVACIASVAQALCCGGIAAYLAWNTTQLDVPGEDAYYDEAFRVQYAAQPVWSKTLIATTPALLPLLAILVLILLLLPASNRYYRSRKPPPPPVTSYPPAPAYGYPPPQYPYPPQPQYPPPVQYPVQYPQPQYPPPQQELPPPGWPPPPPQ
jgi:hypothetical protein